jgi:16S rRNA (cytidine1402-2'-O)-methyltransferase
VGFLPAKATQRRRFLEQLGASPVPTVAFESPRRILAALRDIRAVLGERPVAVAREMTKLHEEFLRGTCSEVITTLEQRPKVPGEITLILGAGEPGGPASGQTGEAVRELPIKERVQELMEQRAMSRMEALKTIARERGISKSEAYRQFES